MEYYRDPQNQIQADMAYRLGIIAKQYSSFHILEDKNFSTTLDICILQSLLTNCITLLNDMTKHERRESYLTAELAITNLWGLNPDMVQMNTFATPRLTVDVVLRRIRNALSHPSILDLEKDFPSTGYSTIPDGTGRISQCCFINSPDVRDNKPKSFSTEEKGEAYLNKRLKEGDIPKDVIIIQDGKGQFILSRNGYPFACIFKIFLNVREIHELVIGLSNHLAQPIQRSWDGITITTLVV